MSAADVPPDWPLLTARFRKGPFFSCRWAQPAGRPTAKGVEVRFGYQFYALPLLGPAFAALCLQSGAPLVELRLFGYFVAAAGVGALLLSILKVRHVAVVGGAEVRVSAGFVPITTVYHLPIAALGVRTRPWQVNNVVKHGVELFLLGDPEQSFLLTASASRQEAMKVYTPLAQALGDQTAGASADGSLVKYKDQLGRFFTADPSPLPLESWRYHHKQLQLKSEDVLQVVPTLTGWALPILSTIVLAGGVALRLLLKPKDRIWDIIVIVFMLAGGAWIAWRAMRGSLLVMDKSTGLLRGSGLAASGLSSSEPVPLTDVAAVQICRNRETDTSKPLLSRTEVDVYQLILLIGRPETRRVLVLTDRNSASVVQNAEQLARFLDVPLLDHGETM